MAADAFSNLVPTADEMMEKVALAEAEKASVELRRQAKAEAEKKALIDRMTKPSGLSDEEVMKRAAAIIQRAVSNGFLQVQVYRFPNTLGTDHGRAINNQEPGWENTLTGGPSRDLRVLEAQPPRPRLQVHLRDRRLSRWSAGRRRILR